MIGFVNTLLVENPLLMTLLDLLFKSVVIVAFTALIAYLFRKRLPSSSTHLLWLNGILCVGLLPVIGSFVGGLVDAIPASQIFTLTVTQDTSITASGPPSPPHSLLLFAYLIPCAILLSGLVRAGVRAWRIVKDADFAENKALLEIHNRVRQKLGISRSVNLKFSAVISSPLSFGLFAPAVVLPDAAKSWDQSTLESILIHELSHIKRLDWPALLLSRLVCIAFWINPLIWFAYARLNENAEKSCDSAVVRYGKSGTDYAESLLALARTFKANNQQKLLAQMILDRSTLSSRIKYLVNGTLFEKSKLKFLLALPLLSILIVLAGSKTQTFAAESAGIVDQEYLPMSTVVPEYPAQAVEQQIEGWILFKFTVSEQGTILEETIETVDSSPADVFDRSAYRALVQFTFQPRVVDGEAVEVPGVQYLFRYELRDDGNPDFDRDPPPPRDAGDAIDQ